MIEGTIIEGRVIEGTVIEAEPDPAEDEDSPFISSTGVRISTTAIVAASLQQPSPATNRLFMVSINNERSRQAKTHRSASIANRYYSVAVSAYWRSDLHEARKYLTAGVAANDQDARLWYFKALAEVRLGLESDALASLGRAVHVESQHPEQSRKVNAALERVQGPLRIKIQRARTAGRRVQADRVAQDTVPTKFASR